MLLKRFLFNLILLLSITTSAQAADVPVTVQTLVLTPAAACAGSFTAHELDHVTTTADGVVRMFEANGSGLAVSDLDNDGDLDLFLGNHAGPNTLLWNEGDLHFRKEPLGTGSTRAVTAVDVDNDGWRDLVLTLNSGAINYWRNLGNSQFERTVLPGVSYPAYVLNWGDLDRDGDLDLVTASYDAGILTDVGNSYLLAGGSRVIYYENRSGRFRPTRLAQQAQALALLLTDLNGDGWQDILVGNDFAVRDQSWLYTPDGWQLATPFATTTLSTMSLDAGDIDNDGQAELFAADMNPYDISPRHLAAYLPVIDALATGQRRDDPQRMANALQVRTAGDDWRNEAMVRGVDATGWSWASKFGDLDNDGYLDLYVVNGMMEAELLAHLPNHELVEENLVFHNDGRGRFTPRPEWGLGSTASGRSMVMADLDQDGDLDIVINNLLAPAQLFENRLCTGASLQVDLSWLQGQNRDALGTRLFLHTALGSLSRDLRAGSGYLSADAARSHFGLPVDTPIERLEILWPDGERSTVATLPLNAYLQIVRH